MSKAKSEKTRWGILGMGRHVRKTVIPCLLQLDTITLAAIASQSHNKHVTQDTTLYSDYDSLIEDPTLDLIYIALPNHLHYPWIMKSLAQGKHVLCEKPLCTSLEEATTISSYAREQGKMVFEGFMYQHHRQHQEVTRLIDQGRIGTMHLLEAHFHYYLQDSPTQNIRLTSNTLGGGLNDVGCYLLHLSYFITQQCPLQIAGAWTKSPPELIDETAHLSLFYKNGMAAHLSCGCKYTPANHYTIYGSHGRLHVPSAFLIPRNKPGIIEIHGNTRKKRFLRLRHTISTPSNMRTYTSIYYAKLNFPSLITNNYNSKHTC